MRQLLALFFIVLSSCSVRETMPKDSAFSESVASDVSVLDEQPLEQLPSELSIEHFGMMRLVGSDFTLGDIEVRTALYTRYGITYVSNGLTISGILNVPHGDGPFPLVMLNHGFIDPDIYTRGRGLKREQDYLARQGFAVLHSDYRGHAFSDPSPDERNVYDASLEYSMDVVNGIQALRSANLPHIDTSWVGMLGHSLGGGVTLNIAVAYPDLLDAIVLYAPVHADAWQNFLRWREMREEGDRTREAFGTREENPEFWDRLSSQTYLDRITAPVLVFHGDQDGDVPKEWSDDLVNRLKEEAKDVTYVEYTGEKHEFISKWSDFMRQTNDFFQNARRGSSSVASQDEGMSWLLPIDRASARITKKPFGILITPEESPVQPERFQGYHTGADFELLPGEDPHTVTIRTACEGPIASKNWVKGYGGVVVQRCERQGEPVTVLYGHLWLDSVKAAVGDSLDGGEAFGVLGEGGTSETDHERSHLHFSIHRGSTVELRGYVQRSEDLSAWFDPLIGL